MCILDVLFALAQKHAMEAKQKNISKNNNNRKTMVLPLGSVSSNLSPNYKAET